LSYPQERARPAARSGAFKGHSHARRPAEIRRGRRRAQGVGKNNSEQGHPPRSPEAPFVLLRHGPLLRREARRETHPPLNGGLQFRTAAHKPPPLHKSTFSRLTSLLLRH